MKNLFLTIAFFSVLLLIGCQENSIVDPVLPESINKDSNPASNITSGSIKLEGLLVLPGGFQSYYTIEGEINYTHELIMLDPIPPAPQYYIDLGLSVSAKLNSESQTGDNSFNISSESKDIIYVSEEGIYILEKSFSIDGSNNGLALVCQFLVTTDGIGLHSRWLVVNAEDELNNRSTPVELVTYPPVEINVFQ